YMVFDLETTGLSTKYDHIIEFGGVIVKGNEIGQHYQTFVKPPVRIPPFIEQKTNITNEMLENAPKLEEVIDDILNFIGDRVIVAHNADFDFNFIELLVTRVMNDVELIVSDLHFNAVDDLEILAAFHLVDLQLGLLGIRIGLYDTYVGNGYCLLTELKGLCDQF
ncbi:MAG: hypothetical protein IIY51_00315, partial [Erysipelotrichaceae bacterium]|nr:hypothetical protein [Erysipelotrichaceae bacterium]